MWLAAVSLVLRGAIMGGRGVTRQVSPAELRRLYEQQRLVPAEIAERLGVSSRTVRAWLRRLEIPL